MAIILKNVEFSYQRESLNKIIDIEHFIVETGELVFLRGPSGCGKTTLLHILSGMLSVTKGDINVVGYRLNILNQQERDKFRANHIGYVFQQFNLIPYLNAIENITLANYFCEKKPTTIENVKSLLSSLNISKSDWNKPTSNLSFGQKQRVAIARALINSPDLILADEPTAALDNENQEKFISILKSHIRINKTTLIFVSHDESLAKKFDRSVIFSDINKRKNN